jgi:hypothetical protein
MSEGLASAQAAPPRPEVVDEASTVAEQHWNDTELKVVQRSRCQVLLSDVGAAPSMTSLPPAASLACSSAESIPSGVQVYSEPYGSVSGIRPGICGSL